MKKTINTALIVAVLLFVCYRLLFIFMDVSSIFMESDSDINTAGKAFLAAGPFILLFGVWVVYRAFRAYSGADEYEKHVFILLSLYGGLSGVVIADMAIHSLPVTIQSYIVVGGILVISFFASAVLTFFSTKYLLMNKIKSRKVEI